MVKKILIVDDEPLNRQILCLFLRSLEFEVMEAENGKQALHLIGQYSFDLILLDIMLPDISGLEVLKITSCLKDFKIPIIIHTSNTHKELKAVSLQLGAVDYLLKPYDLDLLEKRVKDTMV